MPLIHHAKRPAVGAKPGGRYAGGLIPIGASDHLQAANPFDEDGTGPSLAQSIAASNAALAAKGGDRFAHLGANSLAAAAVPDPRMTGRVSTIGAEGYSQMLKNMQNGTFGNQQQAKPAAPGNPLVSAAAQAPGLQSGQPQGLQQSATGNPLVAGVTPARQTQPNGLSISNGMDSGSGLQITNGFDSPAPAAPAPQAAAPVAPQQPAQPQPQKFARGRVPNALINGIVRGEGGPTEDKVPAKVSPDEAILPAKTVQALGGPAAIKALIERTNDGQPLESEVRGSGKYADGAVPGFVADWQDAMERGAPIRQDVENLTQLGADTVAYARRPADAFMDKVARSGNQIAGASRQAIGDFSGVSRRMSDIPAEDAATYAAQPSPKPLTAGIAKPPETPTTTPAATSLAAAGRRPSAPIQSGGPLVADVAPYRNTPDAPPSPSNALAQSVDMPSREQTGPKVAVIADPAAQERRAFDNFVTRSNGEAAYRDAIRSGKPQNIQVASNALANLTKIGDEQEAAAGAFQQGLEGLRQKSAAERDAEDNKGRWSLAQYAQQGRNAMAAETVRGNNALVTEAMRGRNNLDVADVRAKSEQAGREYINPLDAQIKQAQVADSNVRAALRDQVLKGSPAEQQAAAKQLAALDGKFQDRDSAEVAKARMALVGDIAKAYNGPMGVPLGPDKMPISFDQYAAPVLRAAGAGDIQSQQQAPSFEQYSSQIRARNPGQQLTDKQLQDAYGERYGASASQAPGTVSTGQVINGYRFNGGDPGKQSSWEKVGDTGRPSIIKSGLVSSVPLVGPSLGLAQWAGRHFSR